MLVLGSGVIWTDQPSEWTDLLVGVQLKRVHLASTTATTGSGVSPQRSATMGEAPEVPLESIFNDVFWFSSPGYNLNAWFVVVSESARPEALRPRRFVTRSRTTKRAESGRAAESRFEGGPGGYTPQIAEQPRGVCCQTDPSPLFPEKISIALLCPAPLQSLSGV